MDQVETQAPLNCWICCQCWIDYASRGASFTFRRLLNALDTC